MYMSVYLILLLMSSTLVNVVVLNVLCLLYLIFILFIQVVLLKPNVSFTTEPCFRQTYCNYNNKRNNNMAKNCLMFT